MSRTTCISAGALLLGPLSAPALAQCAPRPECQDVLHTTAYNVLFPSAESFVPSESGTITAACLQGVFWDGGPLVECTGTEHWYLSIHDDDAGLPGALVAQYEAGDGVATPTMSVTRSPGVGSFGGIPMRIMEFSGLSVPVAAGNTYFISLHNTESCWFLWAAGIPGDATAFQDNSADGYDFGDNIAEDLNFCFALDVATSACSPADITTQGAGAGDPGFGDPGFGVPDGIITAADINFYVNAWVGGDLGIADLTTQGAGAGDPDFGVPDGITTAADINFYVNLWVAGCP